MTILDLGKLRFHMAGDYVPDKVYEINDVAKYGGNVYVYTFALKQSGVLPTTATHWALMVEGIKFQGVYDPTAEYKVAETVVHGARVYVAIKDSMGIIPPNATYWSLFADGIRYLGTYDGNAAYRANDVVTHGGRLCMATQDVSGHDPSDTTYWKIFLDGISPQGVYNHEQVYLPGQLAAFGPTVYRAKVEAVGLLPPTNPAAWEVFVPGLKNRGNHATATLYYPDEIAGFGGSLYQCLVYHASTDFEADLALGRWQKFLGGVRWRSNWATGTSYLTDDTFRHGASTYRATTAHIADASFATDLTAGRVELMVQGADFAAPDPALMPDGMALIVRNGVYVLEDISTKTLVVSANSNLARNTIYAVDSTAGSFSLTLPAAPSVGDTVRLFDAGGNLSGFPVTVLRNGIRINRRDDDLLLDVSEASLSLAYINSTIGWKVY